MRQIMHAEVESGLMKNCLDAEIEVGMMQIMYAEMNAGWMKIAFV